MGEQYNQRIEVLELVDGIPFLYGFRSLSCTIDTSTSNTHVCLCVCVVHVHIYASVTCVEVGEEEWFIFL